MGKKECSRLERSQEKTLIDVARGKAKCDAATEYIHELDKEFDGGVYIDPSKKKKKKQTSDDLISTFKKAHDFVKKIREEPFF